MLKKERLEQIIDSNIQRRIDGVRYNAVRLNKTRPGKVLFVVYVPESARSPHMANHRFYKRLEFESKAMEEYEVRERYGRVTFPGKDVVEAWRDDAINPLITTLESNAQCLRSETWTWNHFHEAFGGLAALGNHRQFSANAEDFISRHSEIPDSLSKHDEALMVVNNEGKMLFEKTARSSFIQDVFAWATSEESLGKLGADNAHIFKGTSASEIFTELFGVNPNVQERLVFFAEWAINGVANTNVDPMVAFWRAYGDGFRNLVIYPPLSEYRRNVEKAREELLEIGLSLMIALKDIRRELSERHNVALQATRLGVDDSYGGPRTRGGFY